MSKGSKRIKTKRSFTWKMRHFGWVLVRLGGLIFLVLMAFVVNLYLSGQFDIYFLIMNLVILGVFGSLMLFFSQKNINKLKKFVDSEEVKSKPQTLKPQMPTSSIKSEEINVGFSVRKRASVLMDFDVGDILTFSIIFEGHLPMSETVNPVDIAKEIIDDAHSEGKLGDIHLTPFAFVDMRRADEAKYYQDDSYTPQSDLEMLEKETLERLRDTYNTHETLMRLINVKRMAFKSRSRVVSICWVLINVKS